jgi:hypothetical protein
MSIFIPHPGSGLRVQAKYVPLQQRGVLVRIDDNSHVYPAAFSPWIIGPNSAHAPSRLVGLWSLVQLGPVDVSIGYPTLRAGAPKVKAITSQSRPPNPLKGHER